MTLPAPSRTLHGVLFVIAAVALFACFDAGVKVASAIAPVGLVVWARYLFQVGFTAVTVLPNTLDNSAALLAASMEGLEPSTGTRM